MSELRNRLRAKALNPSTRFLLLDLDGDQIELRVPSLAVRKEILTKCGVIVKAGAQDIDHGKVIEAAAEVLFQCTYEPGTNNRLFDTGDRETFFEGAGSVLVDRFYGQAYTLLLTGTEAAASMGKASGKTTKSTSSTSSSPNTDSAEQPTPTSSAIASPSTSSTDGATSVS